MSEFTINQKRPKQIQVPLLEKKKSVIGPEKNVPPKKIRAKQQHESMETSKDEESHMDIKVPANPVGRPKKSQSSQEDALAHSPGVESSEGKSEQKAQQKPGKYVCDYCGRACAKPSVLKKHIRSHTGERPYPCVPCGFSFKTKSNLYKHRKSHAHSVKAGTLSETGTYGVSSEHGSFEGEGEFSDGDQSTDTDEDTMGDPLLLLDTEGSDNTAVKVLNLIAQKRGTTIPPAAHEPQESHPSPSTLEARSAIPSSAIKQRLALRLSEKRSGDSEHNLSLPSQSSKGSTDSGYFSRSESSEHQTGPPNTNAKSYQEIMFGKCYRPSPKQALYVSESSDRGVSRVFTQEKDIGESIKINTKSFTREEIKEPQMDSSDIALLIRSNSMPTSSAVSLPTSQALRGSHSFDERASTGGSRRLRRQAAFECTAHETHADPESHAKISETLETENYPSVGAHLSHYHRHALELATRKRRKEKREEEDLPVQYEAHHEQGEEPMYEGDFKARVYEMDVALSAEISTRRTLGNVISVIQHTNSLNRLQMEQAEQYKYHSSQHYQPMEASETYELERSDSRLRQSFQMGPKLVRQPNIQVPEIRVTVEPDSPEKVPEVQVKEPEKHVEEFQWPQRSETLAQFPPEKLPPKKKRLRLAELEHSSGESSFESACTSLSRSPSQDSNLSYSSTFSFDREDSMKSPGRQDEFGKELLAVPGSSGSHSLSVLHQRQQREMQRSSSEQAPCNLRKELPEVRSISFDYGSLSTSSKFKHIDYAKGEKRRGNLVRQESLNMETESTHQLSHHFLPQSLPIFSTGSAFPQLPHPSLLVPVRLQTNVPSFCSLTYTTVSQIFDNPSESISLTSPTLQLVRNPDHHHSQASSDQTIEALDLSSAKLKTGIPLSLTSRTISTTNASSGGASKRMLSPASSLDLFMEVKQQKRVKEERMFGEIVEELSAVELGKCNLSEEKFLQKAMEEPSSESSMDSSSMEVNVMSIGDAHANLEAKHFAMDVVAKLPTTAEVMILDREHTKILCQFPSLRTTTGVSWCYLNYTKPSSSEDAGPPFHSVYAVWRVSSHNPNPLDLSTGAALALLRSRQKGGPVIYSAAQMCQPGAGKLVSSLLLWRHTAEQVRVPAEETGAARHRGRRRLREEAQGREAESGQRRVEGGPGQSAPTRIKIFEGGFKSNEDYVYVRGRGRGKYICEECGIRCKKPSMLKKHIRTHTDVRPYVCKVCNFAFKTKGNLTKHMKSKAHMKKCLELGVSVSVDDTEIQEHVDDVPPESKAAKHQFSDAEDSDGGEEEELDDEEEEEEEYEGDSTPKLQSRSTSPQPFSLCSTPVTALPGGGASCPSASISAPGGGGVPKRSTCPAPPPADDDSLTLLSPDQSFLFDPYSSCLLSPGWESPIREPSPSRLRYPSPRRELSPRGRSTPRWDTSPLRPGSPGFTPIQHLSPGAMERPLSPGSEVGKRGRQRVVLRAVSPRRGGSHQHKGDKTRHQAKMEMVQQQQQQHQGATEMEMVNLIHRCVPDSVLHSPILAPSLPPNLLSHLPLHSQQTQRSLLPAGPVGGVHMPPCSPPPEPPVPVASPQSSEAGSAHSEQDRTPSATPSSSSARDSGQEENVQTCLKAIASLKITAEEHLWLGQNIYSHIKNTSVHPTFFMQSFH
uniref:HIVEP zinc finger 2b n=1 Tax=Neogobius melanostomus TaxID=47308 RepID=A0A8C6TAN0_9GOBI